MVRYMFQLTFESVFVFSCQRGPKSLKITEKQFKRTFDIISIHSFWVVDRNVILSPTPFSRPLPPKRVDGYDVKCSFELLFRDLKRFGPPLTAENEDRLKCQLKHISYHYIYSYDFSKQRHILSKEEWEALTDLRKDDSIIITKPDKGNGVVIINKLDYLNKIQYLKASKLKKKHQ